MTGIERLQMMQQKGKKEKRKKLDTIVRGVLFYWIIFVSLAWITFWVKDSVPDTLIQYGLGGGAVELIVSGVIEIARDKLTKKEDQS